MSRVVPRRPRHAVLSRYLMSVPCGRPTFNGCLTAVVVLAIHTFGPGPVPVPGPTQLGTAHPRWVGPTHSTPSRRWEIHGQGAALEAVAADTM
ncbi:MAG: hypothetical protein AAGC46_06540 [Solirubrobacteraceae bacterium]|nr:hypothetical protein [Patulibacter sp.]